MTMYTTPHDPGYQRALIQVTLDAVELLVEPAFKMHSTL